MRVPPTLLALLVFAVAACSSPPVRRPSPPPDPGAATGPRVVGYFTGWGVYGRDYQVAQVERSGSAAVLTDLVYAFGRVKGGRCAPADSWADFERPITAADSVDGTADDPDDALLGNFGQLRKLKARHPGLRVIWSFGGWNGSDGFTDAVRDPAAFAESCLRQLADPRWAGVFDGIDIDWEYPNACGTVCDSSGRDGLARVLSALRTALGPEALITAAVPGDVGKLTAADYASAARSADWLSAMTYDYFGTGADGAGAASDGSDRDGAGSEGSARDGVGSDGSERDGAGSDERGSDGGGGGRADTGDLHRTEPHSPLTTYPGIPRTDSTTSATVDELLRLGVPPGKVLLGIGFYGRGWTGVSSARVGGPATGPADGRFEKGTEDYRILADRCPPTGTIGGTAYAHCDSQWWSYDTPQTIKTKMAYAKSKALGGAFAWELSGDTTDGVLVKAIATTLRPGTASAGRTDGGASPTS